MPAINHTWRPFGFVIDPNISIPDDGELTRVLSREKFDTIEGAEVRALELCKDAEVRALELCKEWIDRR
jgi:hypothetical protein